MLIKDMWLRIPSFSNCCYKDLGHFFPAQSVLFETLELGQSNSHYWGLNTKKKAFPLSLLRLPWGEGLAPGISRWNSESFQFEKVVVRFYSTISTKFQLHYGLKKNYREAMRYNGKNMNSGVRQTWIRIPAPTLTSCVNLGKSVYLSKPQFPHLQNGGNNTYLKGGCKNKMR
jgi:hypothetical protein